MKSMNFSQPPSIQDLQRSLDHHWDQFDNWLQGELCQAIPDVNARSNLIAMLANYPRFQLPTDQPWLKKQRIKKTVPPEYRCQETNGNVNWGCSRRKLKNLNYCKTHARIRGYIIRNGFAEFVPPSAAEKEDEGEQGEELSNEDQGEEPPDEEPGEEPDEEPGEEPDDEPGEDENTGGNSLNHPTDPILIGHQYFTVESAGILYCTDKEGNVFHPEDVLKQIPKPRIIGKVADSTDMNVHIHFLTSTC